MAFIYSISARVEELMKQFAHKREVSTNNRAVRNFVAFHSTQSKCNPHGASGKMAISAELSLQMGTSEKVICGYDEDSNELIVVPTIHGNMDCRKSNKYSNSRYIIMRSFFKALGFNRCEFPHGRYEASVDEGGNLHVYLERKLPDDEQGNAWRKTSNATDMAALQEVIIDGKPQNIERR